MLKHLEVKDFAIIENIEVSFEPGMNVLTGETGAGKSLLIDAIGLLLGDRAQSDIVRTDSNEAVVRALFSPLSDHVKHELATLDIPFEDDELLIERRVKRSSGNRIKMNRETVTLQDLRQVTSHLADIHTQHDTKRLINPTTYLELLDGYDKAIEPLKKDYKNAFEDYKEALNHYRKLKEEKNSTLEKMDMLRFQLQELKSHDLKKDEEASIEARLKTLENFDTIFTALKEAYSRLDEGEALDDIYQGAQSLSRVESLDESYKAYRERIESAYYELDDIRQSLYDDVSGMDFDPDELEELQSRQFTLNQLKRKYARSIDELVDYQAKIEHDLESFGDYDNALKNAEETVKKTHATLKKKAETLSAKRRETAKTIEQALESELFELELKHATFRIVFETPDVEDPFNASGFKPSGTDAIDFHLSTNKGEPLKPLKSVASGGELSRIMLALKTLLLMQDTLDLIIFDEIDTGVSGYVASQVAKKMAAISENVQVLAITHLPQVAAKSDHHYFIYKEEKDERTKTHVDPLDHDGRIKALATMISSDTITEQAMKSARELLK
ncbi:MAG: DNA repair protein RecN [Bacillota bacterium]